MVIDVKLVHSENANIPIAVTLLGITIDVRLLHFLKVSLLISVILGKSTFVKFTHPQKAELLISSTLLGMVIDVRPLQSRKAL